MIGAQSAFALTAYQVPLAYAQSVPSKHPQVDYQSGLKWGIHDAKDKHNTYLFQPGNGFINQTDSFINGYVIGYCSVVGPNVSFDEPEGDFDCNKGPDSAGWDVGHTINGNFTSKFPSRNGYWTASDSGTSGRMETYHLFLVGTYPSSKFIGAELVNQNVTVCLDFTTNQNNSGAAVCHPIKESEIPLKNDSVVDAGFFVVPRSLNESDANICVQVGYRNLYSCDHNGGFDPYSVSYPKLFYDMRNDIYNVARAYDYCIHNHPEDDPNWCVEQVT